MDRTTMITSSPEDITTIRGAILNLLVQHHNTILWMAFSIFCLFVGMGVANGFATYSAVQDAWKECQVIQHQTYLKSQGLVPNGAKQ